MNDRWYCVSHDGMATLCLDEVDALVVAADGDLTCPRKAPHKAMQLIDAAEVKRLREALIEIQERLMGHPCWMDAAEETTESEGGDCAEISDLVRVAARALMPHD